MGLDAPHGIRTAMGRVCVHGSNEALGASANGSMHPIGPMRPIAHAPYRAHRGALGPCTPSGSLRLIGPMWPIAHAIH